MLDGFLLWFHEIYWMFMEISLMDLVIYCDMFISNHYYEVPKRFLGTC